MKPDYFGFIPVHIKASYSSKLIYRSLNKNDTKKKKKKNSQVWTKFLKLLQSDTR